MRRAGFIVLLAVACGVLALGVIAFDVARFGTLDNGARADAALVLGAAVLGDRPSPVLAERLGHALALLEGGRVQRLVLTGGRSPEDDLSEAEAGRLWLRSRGVAESAIVLEDQSRTTLENFTFARPILIQNDIKTVLVVSDPLHMRRAMEMAERTGVVGAASPTPTTRYVSLETQLPCLARETLFMAQYLLLGQ